MLRTVIARQKGDEETFKKYIGSSLENFENQTYDIYDVEDKVETIFHKYNLAIQKMVDEKLDDEDIVIFVHNDVRIVDELFQIKVETVFKNNKEVGLLGVVGTKKLAEIGMWWCSMPIDLKGHCIQENDGKEVHLIKGTVAYSENMIAVDGLILMIRGKLFNEGLRFDESFPGFHFYDIDLCLQVLERKYKVAVADILVLHRSVGLGSLSKEWKSNKDLFVKKWKEKGYTFPLIPESFRKVGHTK